MTRRDGVFLWESSKSLARGLLVKLVFEWDRGGLKTPGGSSVPLASVPQLLQLLGDLESICRAGSGCRRGQLFWPGGGASGLCCLPKFGR